MADLRTLLHESAPRPRSPLDLEALHARARRRTNRRFATWLGVAGLALGIGVPGGTVFVTADRGDDHRVAPPTTTTTSTPSSADDATDADERSTATTGRGVSAAASSSPAEGRLVAPRPGTAASDADAGPSSDAPPTSLRGTTSTTAAPRAAEYPPAAACTVDNAGLGPNEQRRCRFTATAAGGASRRPYGDEVNSPQGQVLVTRNGTTTAHPVFGAQVFAGDIRRGCEDLFIQPGDLVEVVLTNAASGTREVMTIGAGERWQCWGDE